VGFYAARTKVTSVRISALVGTCTGPLASNLAAFSSGATEGTASVKKDGSFSLKINRLSGAVTGVLSGRLHNRTATGTLSLTSIYTEGNLLNASGSTTCTTGVLKWTAKFV
jgi:hypothetical protein